MDTNTPLSVVPKIGISRILKSLVIIQSFEKEVKEKYFSQKSLLV